MFCIGPVLDASALLAAAPFEESALNYVYSTAVEIEEVPHGIHWKEQIGIQLCLRLKPMFFWLCGTFNS